MALFEKHEETNEELMLLYAVKDNLNGFAAPIPFPNEDTAIRFFEYKCKNDPMLSFAPTDYEFFYLGGFNPKTGDIIYIPAHVRCVKKGAEYAKASD